MRPSAVDGQNSGLTILIGDCLQDVSDTLASGLGRQGVLEGTVAASTDLAICLAIDLAINLRRISPTTMPLTPPSGFLKAVNRPNLNPDRISRNFPTCQS